MQMNIQTTRQLQLNNNTERCIKQQTHQQTDPHHYVTALLLCFATDDVHYNAAELSALASSKPYAEAAAKERGVPVT
jgi:hypothetical protein